jgi:hypothetical protein
MTFFGKARVVDRRPDTHALGPLPRLHHPHQNRELFAWPALPAYTCTGRRQGPSVPVRSAWLNGAVRRREGT